MKKSFHVFIQSVWCFCAFSALIFSEYYPSVVVPPIFLNLGFFFPALFPSCSKKKKAMEERDKHYCIYREKEAYFNGAN